MVRLTMNEFLFLKPLKNDMLYWSYMFLKLFYYLIIFYDNDPILIKFSYKREIDWLLYWSYRFLKSAVRTVSYKFLF